jgi:hypothetical protein
MRSRIRFFPRRCLVLVMSGVGRKMDEEAMFLLLLWRIVGKGEEEDLDKGCLVCAILWFRGTL